MSVAAPGSRSSERPLAGHNRVSAQALTSLAQAAAARHFGVRPQDVRVGWSDDAGLLALTISCPVAVRALGAGRDPSEQSVWSRAVAAKAGIVESVSTLSGSRLGRVDIRVSGVRIAGVEGGGEPRKGSRVL